MAQKTRKSQIRRTINLEKVLYGAVDRGPGQRGLRRLMYYLVTPVLGAIISVSIFAILKKREKN